MPALPERLYLVTDRRVAGGEAELCARVARALAGAPRGHVLVQLRDKDLDDDARIALGRELRALCRAAGARLLVNGRVDVARALDADGVHLPDDETLSIAAVRAALAPGALVGASTHTPARAAAQLAAGADLVTLGPVWPTPSKPGPDAPAPLGTDALGAAARLAGPGACVLALGGVEDATRAHAAVRAGAHGVAVIRAVLAAADPGAAAAALCAAVEAARG